MGVEHHLLNLARITWRKAQRHIRCGPALMDNETWEAEALEPPTKVQ
jgi:hypothetical protein